MILNIEYTDIKSLKGSPIIFRPFEALSNFVGITLFRKTVNDFLSLKVDD